MPQILQITLDGPAPRDPFQHMSGLRVMLLDCWECRNDPLMAGLLHDANQPKPYTVSPLRAGPGAGRVSFHVSVLIDGLADALWTRLGPDVRLGTARFSLAGPPVLVGAASWEELRQTPAPPVPRWTVRLETPTAHHPPGPVRKVVWLPTPEAYFGSWLSLWNLYAPAVLNPAILDVVVERVAVSDFQGGLERAALQPGCPPWRGFVGTVVFDTLQPATLPSGAAQTLGVLARFAPFCGTGVETGRGMGQTRLLRAPSSFGEKRNVHP